MLEDERCLDGILSGSCRIIARCIANRTSLALGYIADVEGKPAGDGLRLGTCQHMHVLVEGNELDAIPE